MYLIGWTFIIIIASVAYLKISTWRRNYKTAQSAGFPTFYSPVHITDMWWLMLYPLLAPWVKMLPASWQKPWLALSQVWNIWKVGHEPFSEAGGDNLFLATPNGNMLWTCDHAVIKQLFTLHTVQVPVDMLRFYDIWGPTVGSVEGEEWRTHRKVVTYGLNPSTQPIVWKEAIHQTKTLIDRWAIDKYRVPVAKQWTSRLALHTIASVFFDLKLEWKEYSPVKNASAEGYQITFANALFTVLARLGMVFMVPRALLKILPFKACQETFVALTDLTKYMKSLRAKAMEKIDEVAAKRDKTILESIVVAGTQSPDRPDSRHLSEESVLGNIFFTLMAGHETTGNTLAFSVLLLAVYPEYQVQIQQELDRQLGSRSKEQWNVEKDYQVLQKGHMGAFLKEVLRLYNVVQFIFRLTVAPTPVKDSKGTQHVIPANTTCLINFSAAFQNPQLWDQNPVSDAKREELHHSQAIDFNPSRWLEATNEDELYWPFGYGARKCPGMPFAQVEMIAVLSTILKDYSLELEVSEDILRQCNGDSKAAWQQVRDQAIRQLKDDVEANINIQMLKDLPVRLVKRSAQSQF